MEIVQTIVQILQEIFYILKMIFNLFLQFNNFYNFINVIPNFDNHQYTINITVTVPRFGTQQVTIVGTLDKSGFYLNN